MKKHDGSHEPQGETTTGASSCSHLSLQCKNWSNLEVKVGWKISWGSSPQNPWVVHTATLKTGNTEASAQKLILPRKLWDTFWWGMLPSRKEPTENPVPTPLVNLDKSLPLCSCHNRPSFNWKCGGPSQLFGCFSNSRGIAKSPWWPENTRPSLAPVRTQWVMLWVTH